jgi:hypothetical protein
MVIPCTVPRTFTIDEANALVSRMIPVLRRTAQMSTQLRRLSQRLALQKIRFDAFGEPPDEKQIEAHPELGLASLWMLAIRQEARTLEGFGVVVRDVHRGVIELPSVVDGERDVLLIWELGERSVRTFRELHASDRQSVDGHRFFRSRQLRAPSE